jgi:hypothetical protein
MGYGMTREEIKSFVDSSILFYDGLKDDTEDIISAIKKDYLWYAVLAVPVLETEYEEVRRDFLETFVQKWSEYAEKANKKFIEVSEKLGSVRCVPPESNLESHLENYPIILTKLDENLSMMYIYFKHMIFENIYVRPDSNSVQLVLYRYSRVLQDTIKALYSKYERKFGLSLLYVHDTIEQDYESAVGNMIFGGEETDGSAPNEEEELIKTVFDENCGVLYNVESSNRVFEGLDHSVYGDFISYLKENPYNAEKHDILFRNLE